MIRFFATSFAFLLFPLLALAAGNPLNLTPGTAATVTLGSIATLANFNTSTGSGEISYSNSDLASRTYVVRLPSGFNAADTTKKYGLVTYIDAGSPHSFPASYAAALDAHDVIWIAGNGIDNAQSVNLRRGVALMGAFRMSELYSIDPARVYASGLSGGGRTASDLAYLRNDYLRGFIGRVGSSIPDVIPGWESAGTNSSNSDADYEVGSGNSVVHPASFRTAIMTQYGDFRRAENLAIYRWGHLNHGNTARAFVRPGGHSDEIGASFTDALRFFHHPLVDVIWDRFENNLLAANVHPGKTAAGSGFSALSGDVTETAYAYNSVNHGVLRLAGDSAVARSNDVFVWKNDFGILLDARLRAQAANTAGQNQQIGLHLVSDSATGPLDSRPGFHLYWCYGAPYRAEIVSATGLRRTLATWEHAATHPMALAATDKTFWGDTAAPDFAGKSKSFRGEDVRLALNASGFQLTFNRYANNLQTTYPGVVLVSQDASTPFAENIPMILQGLWSDVETALVNALPSGDYRLHFSNSALVTGQPVGTAVVDELRLVGPAGQQAAPATLAVTAPANTTRSLAWAQLNGAASYRIQRSTTPDSGFADLATVAGTASTFSDTVPSNIAYYYRVAALSLGATLGRWSAVAFAKRTPSVPAAPSGLAATFPAAAQARLAWTDAAANETAYRVERSPAGFAQWSLVSGLLAAGTTVFLDTSVASGSSYDYRVSALNADGLSAYASLTVNVPDAAPPVPAGLAIPSATFTSASLVWNTVPQAATYLVRRASTSGGPYTTVASGLTSASFTDLTLTPGQSYFYVVRSVGAALESADSTEASVNTPALLPPSNFSALPSFGSVSLSWLASPGVLSYRVERASSLAGPYAVIADNLAATSFLDSALSSGVPLFYRVLSLSGSFASSPAGPVSATPVPGTFIKANNTTALDLPASWSPAVLPNILDTVSWNGTYANGTVSVGAGLSVGTLRLLAPSTAITLNPGTGTLTLGSGGIDLSASTQNLTLNAPVSLSANQTWSIASGRTLTLAAPLTSSVSPAAALTLSGPGTLSYNGNGTASPFPGRFAATSGVLRLNQSSANLTLTDTNFPASSNSTLTSITGASGATLTLDAAPTANLAFASNSAGFKLILKNGNVTYNALTGSTDNTLVRVEGGTFTIPATSARYQLAAANQTFELLGGTVDATRVASFGLRIGGSGSATQAGAQTVVATQSGGTLLATFFSLGGTDTAPTRSPSYALSGGLFAVNSNLQIGADTAASGNSTFTFSGGTLRVPGTLSGAQPGARQIFAMSGGTLAAATINATNLRPSDAASNGVFAPSGGILAPGDLGTAGRTVLTGHYASGPSATLALDLGGTGQASAYQSGQHDFLSVSGPATLDGSLRVSLLPGFTPSAADSFTVLSVTGAFSGAFANVAFGARITTHGGEGSLLVTRSGNNVVLSDFQPALTALQSWRQTHFGQTSATGNAADAFDFDADGVPNLLEYALNTTPTAPTSVSFPSLQVSSLNLQLTFRRARPDLTYIVEASPDLSSWSAIATNPGAVSPTTAVTVTDSADLSVTPRRFLRLRVTAP
jgi:hypothetical protein